MIFNRNKNVVEQDPLLYATEESGRLADCLPHESSEGFLGQIDKLDKDLERFGEGWERINLTVSSYIDSETTQGMMEQTIKEYLHDPQHTDANHRHLRRNMNRLVIRDLSDFVAAQVMFARFQNVTETTGNVMLESNANLREVYALTVKHNEETRAIRGRWSIFTNSVCEHTPTAGRFYESVVQMSQSLSPDFRRIAKSYTSVTEFVDRYVGNRPDRAYEVIKALPVLADSPERKHLLFLQVLAADQAQWQERSMTEEMLRMIKASGDIGGLATRFLITRADQNDGVNEVNFMFNMLQQMQGSNGPEFLNYMIRNKNTWWPGLQSEYSSFASDFVADSRRQALRLLESYLVPQHVPPTRYETEEIFDRLIKRIFGKQPVNKLTMSDEDRRRKSGLRTNFGAQRILPSDQSYQEAQEKVLEPTLIVPSEQGGNLLRSGEPLSAYLGKVVAEKLGDNRYPQDLQTMIDFLCRKPFGPGRVPLNELKEVLSVAGQTVPIYRLNPNHVTGLSVGISGKDSRILYVVKNGNLGILRIFSNHRDYDNYKRNIR